jgi:phosphoribosylamine---glycine ligase
LKKLKVLLLGSGGREAALGWKLQQSELCGRLYALPGNPGLECCAERVQGLDLQHLDDTADWCQRREIDLVVVGPEQPLVDGAADDFRSRGIRCFGPSRLAAELEGSKVWAKDFMKRHGVPTADYRIFEDAAAARTWLARAPWPVVVKADGLAAGKGVVLPEDAAAAEAAVDGMLSGTAFGAAGRRIVVEQRLSGPEVSVFALCDGERGWILATAQDYKRALDGDRGSNTGGMGSISPSPHEDKTLRDFVRHEILDRVLAGMRLEGRPYSGLLYIGLLLARDGPRVIEFNCRFGDPETQVVLPRLQLDLLERLWLIACGEPLETPRRPKDPCQGKAVGLVLASAGYPGPVDDGHPISGLERVEGAQVFQAGTRRGADGRLLTRGGRVLTVVATGESWAAARATAYREAGKISFAGMQLRGDIGLGVE